MATPSLPCANCSPDGTSCQNAGKSSCANCRLVTYCGSECQKAHWPLHKLDCKSPLNSTGWKPDWVVKHRAPAFVGPVDGSHTRFGGQTSGDMRNVVKTIAQLPPGHDKPIEITLNDRDLYIVARNAIMLLIALTADDQDAAAECIIHVWYSSFIRKSDLDILEQRAAESLLGKTWTFGKRSLRLVLRKFAWDKVLRFLNTPVGLTMERANKIRKDVTLAKSRIDYRDRHFLLISPSTRLAKQRFREDGLLLPFGAGRSEFTVPNPTLFQDTDAWQMHDSADPVEGWSAKDVDMTPNGPATSDVYGKFFNHAHSTLKDFLGRISDHDISFKLLQVDAADLPAHVQKGSLDLIEVSNISDEGYLGIHRTVGLMVPLLSSPVCNPHATLITLFMNLIEENMTQWDRVHDATSTSATTQRLLKYLPFTRPPIDELVDEFGIRGFTHYLQAEMKEQQTIVERWPFKLKLRPGQDGAQQEFDRMLGGSVWGKQFYLEWKRV
ncbi:hypothetical protein FANTH_1397 [Fusarium anthophilum]|uniref:MYND-type domain-containing protein n=1 Tax=Fusarium anthophilum TaxID=48485 RepID=A0A8H4ZWB8_9HYPO|nr:hypothetical protein FANTH_1397 [Fusarium anthophilum]